MVRDAVTTAFPGVRFWIRIHRNSPLIAYLVHSVGISVKWVEGPTEAAVNAAVLPLSCTDGYDPQIDWSGFLRTHWLLPEGSVELAERGGSERYGGSIKPSRTPCPHPKAEEVLLAGSVGCRRYRADQWFMQTDAPTAWV